MNIQLKHIRHNIDNQGVVNNMRNRKQEIAWQNIGWGKKTMDDIFRPHGRTV